MCVCVCVYLNVTHTQASLLLLELIVTLGKSYQHLSLIMRMSKKTPQTLIEGVDQTFLFFIAEKTKA